MEIRRDLAEIYARKLHELKYKLISSFKLMADMVRGVIMEFVYDVDKLAFLKGELRGFGVDGYQ